MPANAPKTPLDELDEVLDELEKRLKRPDAGADLTAAGVNVSLALTLVDGVRAYVHADKKKALLELETATDEIAARMSLGERAVRS